MGDVTAAILLCSKGPVGNTGMLEQAQERYPPFGSPFGACIINRGTASEAAILMFPGISRQLYAPGPIQAIFLLFPTGCLLSSDSSPVFGISRH